jgi:hypothetical protein
VPTLTPGTLATCASSSTAARASWIRPTPRHSLVLRGSTVVTVLTRALYRNSRPLAEAPGRRYYDRKQRGTRGHQRRLSGSCGRYAGYPPGRVSRSPAQVLQIAWRAQHRPYRLQKRLRASGKPGNVATVAVARELACLLWAAAVTD